MSLNKIINFLMVLGIAGVVSAADYVSFDNDSGDGLWNTSANWLYDALPQYKGTDMGDWVVHVNPTEVMIVDSTAVGEAEDIYIGWNGICVMEMTGGSLTAHNEFIIGQDTKGVLDMSGGTITSPSFRVGNGGTSSITMTGNLTSTVINATDLRIGGWTAEALGVLNIWGGVVNTTNLIFNEYSTVKTEGTDHIDLRNGKNVVQLVISENLVSGLQGNVIGDWVSNGWLTTYDGAGTVCYDYNMTNPGKTTIWAATDLDGDWLTGFSDIGIMAQNWLGTDCFSPGDFDNDCFVNFKDFALMARDFSFPEPFDDSNIIVGAIRWDAWVGPDIDEVGGYIEKQLSPFEYHYRIPFFGNIIGPNEIQARYEGQATIDAEIDYAKAMGLDYWAFVSYPEIECNPNSGLIAAFDWYLNSSKNADINFAIILGGTAWCYWPSLEGYYADLFVDTSYQTILAGRPLVFLFDPHSWAEVAGWPAITSNLQELNVAVLARGGKLPYYVGMVWSPAEAIDCYNNTGGLIASFSKYLCWGSSTDHSYVRTAANAKNWWQSYKSNGIKVVPCATSGHDSRPQYYNPYPGQKADPNWIIYYNEPGTGEEIAEHIQDAVNWVEDNPFTCPARAVIIYAWNEHTEGGWICPTLLGGFDRLNPIANVLGGSGISD